LAEEGFVEEVTVYKECHKYVIGKGGINIRKIREETGAKIDLPNEGDASDIIRIIGKREAVLEAKVRLLIYLPHDMARIRLETESENS